MTNNKKFDKDFKYLLYLTLTILIILLSIYNLQNLNNPINKVLGASVDISKIESDKEKLFWEEFQKNNPTYIDGWLELGRIDKVIEIDPNYKINN